MKSLRQSFLLTVLVIAAALTGCSSQATFDTPQQAVDALFNATKARDRDALRHIFGPRASELLTGDAEQDEADFQRFAANLERHAEITPEKDGEISLLIGESLTPFVAPLYKDEKGKWQFDTDAGIDEITTRRVGRNELNVINTVRLYSQAQFEYYIMDPDNDGVRTYAQKIRSTAGKKDGLYWPDDDNDPNFEASPLGPLVAEAAAAGDLKLNTTARQPYHGYFYRILTQQSAAAPGGAKNYIDANGRMTGGHALIAWPEKYDNTGVMSFFVDKDGIAYEKDLGQNTSADVEKINEFNPDATWKRITK